jgi:predicted nucleic acid-binding protein
MERILIDTGPIVAALRSRDQHHAACSEQLRKLSAPLYTCWPVLTEAAWLLRQQPSRVRDLLNTCDGNPFEIVTLRSDDLPIINEILAKYADQAIQLADACLVHLAGELDTDRIFTVDQTDFRIFRTPNGKPFRILPETE